jgi:hypothetical protein
MYIYFNESTLAEMPPRGIGGPTNFIRSEVKISRYAHLMDIYVKHCNSGTFDPLLMIETTFLLSVYHKIFWDTNSHLKAWRDNNTALSSL